MLQGQIPDIVKAVHKQLKEKSVKTRQGCFSFLVEPMFLSLQPSCYAAGSDSRHSEGCT